MVNCPQAASGCDYPAGECSSACMSAQPEALRLAAILDYHTPHRSEREAAAELRRLHALNVELLEALKLADLLLSGANMNPRVVEQKVRDAIAKAGSAA